MAKIIVEIFKESGFRRDYKTFETSPIKVGRGYQNDIILPDPYISADHAVIHLYENGWTVEDLNTKNGTYINNEKITSSQRNLASGDEIILGRTKLRVVSVDHPVAPALRLLHTSGFFTIISHPLSVWGAVFLMFTVFCMQGYLGSSEKLSVGKLALGSLSAIALIVIWAAAWSFVGRLIKHRAHFSAQLTFGAIVFFWMAVVFPLSDFIGFAFSNFVLDVVISVIFFAIFFTFLLSGNLAIATNIARPRRILVSSIITGAIISFGLLGYFAVKNEFNPIPGHYSSLKPPYFKVVPSRQVDSFLKRSERVFDIKIK